MFNIFQKKHGDWWTKVHIDLTNVHINFVHHSFRPPSKVTCKKHGFSPTMNVDKFPNDFPHVLFFFHIVLRVYQFTPG
jgi:hypothetical protein